MREDTSNSVQFTRTDSVSDSEVSLRSAGVELTLTQEEREYLLYVQRGDVASVKKILDVDRPPAYLLDINCVDPIGRSAITIAIENENIDLLEALLEREVQPKDALLQAIAEEYVEGVELLLHWEERLHIPGEPYSWEVMTHDTAVYTKDITPLILAAHHNHYEILKLLLDRGASLPMPHDVRCGCDECISSTKDDSLRHSLSRINAYKALSSPSLISLSSKDPLLTAFELSVELSRLEGMEHEFKAEYRKLQATVQEFCSKLLDQISTHRELSTMLNYAPGTEETIDVCEDGKMCSLDRLKLAIKYQQKSFVAHSNVQQFLGAIWYNGLPGFRRLPSSGQLSAVLKLTCMFPVLSISYIINPESPRGQFLKKPFVKFISHCSSYMFFLTLLTLASQRIEYLVIEIIGNEWLNSVLDEWKKRERGALPGPIDFLIIIYVFGLVWSEVKALWSDGLIEYLKDLWNIADFITNAFYLGWIQLRVTSWFLVHRDLWWYDKWPWYPREDWHAYDPMLLSEGCFGAAMIFSFLKLVHIFSVNHHLGPLQISLGRMVFDILKFFFLYTLVLFAFGCGLNQMLWYYAELEMKQCYHLPGGLPDYKNREDSCYIWRRFANLFESSQSLYWASFGLVELDVFDLTGMGSFTRFWCLLMYGGYSVINVIVLLNLLIAMMSNSYQAISEQSDTEWKFARTKLWISFFEDGATVPPPFNLIPTPKAIKTLLGFGHHVSRGSLKDKTRRKADQQHQDVMRLLVRRYITEQQRQADERKVTEDDVNEIKQDVSTFRFQLIDILTNNGMNTSIVCNEDPTVVGRKGRAMERKLMKGFNIGRVEGIVNEILTETKKTGNIFGKLAQAIGTRRKSTKKTDWNARVHRASMRKDQIGSSQTSLSRSQTSIRRRIQFENEQLLQSMNPSSIAEYNPNLESHSNQTRIAYAKFKVNTLQLEKQKELKRMQTEEEGKLKLESGNVEFGSVDNEGDKQKSNNVSLKFVNKNKKVVTVSSNSMSHDVKKATVEYENETKIQVGAQRLEKESSRDSKSIPKSADGKSSVQEDKPAPGKPSPPKDSVKVDKPAPEKPSPPKDSVKVDKPAPVKPSPPKDSVKVDKPAPIKSASPKDYVKADKTAPIKSASPKETIPTSEKNSQSSNLTSTSGIPTAKTVGERITPSREETQPKPIPATKTTTPATKSRAEVPPIQAPKAERETFNPNAKSQLTGQTRTGWI